MQTYPTYGEFQKAYKGYPSTSEELKDKVGSIHPLSKQVIVYDFGGYIEKFANGKSILLYGIYDTAKLVESKASTKKDYLDLKEVLLFHTNLS